MEAIQITDDRCEDWKFIVKKRITDGEIILIRKNQKQKMEDEFYLSKKVANTIAMFILNIKNAETQTTDSSKES